MIAQNVGQRRPGRPSASPCSRTNCPRRCAVLEPLADELGARVESRGGGEQGVDRRHRHADAHRRRREDVRRAGGRDSVNMKMITTGDIKISVLVDKADGVEGAAGGAPGVRPATSRVPAPACPIASGGSQLIRKRPPGQRRGCRPTDIAADRAAAQQHGRHRRQRRAARTPTGPHHHLRTCRTGRAIARGSSRRWPAAASSWT